MKHFPMISFLDHAVWPPIRYVDEYDDEHQGGFDKILKQKKKIKKKRLVVRGIWEPQLVSPKGDVLPPYMERVKNQEQTPFDFEPLEVEQANFLKVKGGSQLIEEIIPIVCVRSFAKFPPSPVKFTFPEFLNNVARVDWTNQGTFDIVVQR